MTCLMIFCSLNIEKKVLWVQFCRIQNNKVMNMFHPLMIFLKQILLLMTSAFNKSNFCYLFIFSMMRITVEIISLNI